MKIIAEVEADSMAVVEDNPSAVGDTGNLKIKNVPIVNFVILIHN